MGAPRSAIASVLKRQKWPETSGCRNKFDPFVSQIREATNNEDLALFERFGGHLMNGKFLLFGGDEIENSLMRFVARKIGEQRRDERRLAEQRTTKHRFQARKSCVADARNYRIARRLPDLSIWNRLAQQT